MRTEFDRAYVTAHGNVAILTLNHPEAMNAAGTKLVKGAAAALNFVDGVGDCVGQSLIAKRFLGDSQRIDQWHACAGQTGTRSGIHYR